MTAQQLKNSILQLAVQGKLVPQDPNDEPACVLLERITKERECLIKEKKIKRPKTISHIFRREGRYYESVNGDEPVCIDEQIPFDIPPSWEWSRLGNVCLNRDAERVPLSCTQREKQHKLYDYYGASGVIDKVESYLFDTKLLLIGEDGANLINRSTDIAFFAEGKYWVNNHAHVLDSFEAMPLDFLSLYVNSISLAPFVTGTAQPKLNQERLNSILVPIPPTLEQQRIVERYESFLPDIHLYDELTTQAISLNKAFPQALKKSILQHAIQGKLVPQDPNDEPAAVLLERISKERERLIKEKKIKRPKTISHIFRRDGHYYESVNGGEPVCIDEQIPFDIPNSWEWVRLGETIELLSGVDLKPDEYNDAAKGIPYITGASNFVNGSVIVNRWTDKPRRISNKGDILITCKGTIGETALLSEDSVHIARQVMGITPIMSDLTPYIILSVRACVSVIISNKRGLIPGIDKDTILSLFLPLPPLSEQHRIVEKLGVLMKEIEATK